MNEREPLPHGTHTITSLHQQVQQAVRKHLGSSTWVVGEIHSKKTSNDNVYIDLVERSDDGRKILTKLNVVALRSEVGAIRNACARAGITITEGLEVRIRGRITTYPPSGVMQLQMDGIDAEWTLGKLVANKDELRKKLEAEGILQRNHRHDIPEAPLRVALLTRRGSAAAEDFLDELRSSGYAWQVLHLDVTVQGERSPNSIANALKKLERGILKNWTPDIVAIVRGGGARSDLAAYDSEEIVRAVTTCSWPVITGIGHEIDHSLADEAAHTSFKTPTAAAQGLVSRVRRYSDQIEEYGTRIGTASNRELRMAGERLEHTSRALHQSSRAQLHQAAQRIEDAAGRLGRCATTRLERAAEELGRSQGKLETLPQALDREAERLEQLERIVQSHDPEQLLERGWAIVHHEGKNVLDPDTIPDGGELHIRVHGGTLHAKKTTAKTTTKPAKTTTKKETP